MILLNYLFSYHEHVHFSLFWFNSVFVFLLPQILTRASNVEKSSTEIVLKIGTISSRLSNIRFLTKNYSAEEMTDHF